jgi:hypothetical protein
MMMMMTTTTTMMMHRWVQAAELWVPVDGLLVVLELCVVRCASCTALTA